MVEDHIDLPYPILITISHVDVPFDISLMSDLPYRYPILISHIDIGSYLVTLRGGRDGGAAARGEEDRGRDAHALHPRGVAVQVDSVKIRAQSVSSFSA